MEFIKVAVFYDISDDKERQKFSEFLKDVGLERVQRSGFMGYIRTDLVKDLYERCSKYPDDVIHVILLYKCREKSVIVFGDGWIPKEEDIWVI